MAVSAVFVGRLLFNIHAVQHIAKAQLLLVGTNPALDELARYITERPQTGLQIAGYVADRAPAVDQPGRRHLGTLDALNDIVQTVRPERIVLGLTTQPDTSLTNRLLEISYAGYQIETVASTYEKVCGKLSLYNLNPTSILKHSAPNYGQQKAFLIQLINRGLAVIGIIVTLPLTALMAARLAAAGRRPILEYKLAIGLDSRVFRWYRFRSLPSSMLGRLARPLEGLPQLFNVLKGEMAFVGPRPDRVEYVEAIERHIPYYRERSRIAPGMTGWAQIHWTAESEPEDTITQLEYDLYYLQNKCLKLDILILLHTSKLILAQPQTAEPPLKQGLA